MNKGIGRTSNSEVATPLTLINGVKICDNKYYQERNSP